MRPQISPLKFKCNGCAPITDKLQGLHGNSQPALRDRGVSHPKSRLDTIFADVIVLYILKVGIPQ